MRSRAILDNQLLAINEYLRDENIEEIILSSPLSVTLYYAGEDKGVVLSNSAITESLLRVLPEQLASLSNQRFDNKIPQLSTSIPSTNHRVQALHSVVLKSEYNTIVIRKQIIKKLSINNFTSNLDTIKLIENISTLFWSRGRFWMMLHREDWRIIIF